MKTRFLAVATVLLSSVAGAQSARRGGPPVDRPEFGPPGGRDGLATMLIDARRELNLTPKQLVALDSVERAEYSRSRQDRDAMRARRDSMCAKRDPCEPTREEMQQMRSRAVGEMSMRLRADSAARTRIFGMLDTTQRRLADRLEYRRELLGPGRGARRMMRETRGRGFGPPEFGPRGFRPRGFERDDDMAPDGAGYGPRRMQEGFGPGMAPRDGRGDRAPGTRHRRPDTSDSLPPDSTAHPTLPDR
ncbi:MAG: hypothetical protein U0132_15875 [Gemmatimonadaceae bacterium]